MLRRVRLTVLTLVVGGLLYGCSSQQSVNQMPPDTRPVVTSAEGLAAFFTAECIEQRNAEWVRRRWRAIPCLDECASIDGDFSWTVPADDGSTVLVEMTWAPRPPVSPPAGALNCSISVADVHRGDLRAAIAFLRLEGLDLASSPETLNENLVVWREASRTHALTLERHESPEEYDRRMAAEGGPANMFNSTRYRAQLARRQSSPWELAVIYQ